MNPLEYEKAVKKDKRKSMRTSIIIHIILILLALLPFMVTQDPPRPKQKAVLVEFDMGGSQAGAQSSAAAPTDEANTESSDMESESESEPEPEPKPEVKPVEVKPTTPILTSDVEKPKIQQTKVKKVDIKVPETTPTIPQPQDVKEIPTKTSEPVIKPSKTRKVTIKIERPSTNKGSGRGTGTGTASTGGTKGGAQAGGDGGSGTGSSGDGQNDGSGKGDSGTGTGKSGDGKGSGEGDGIGDGVLSRPILSYPDLSDIITESGRLTFNVCVDRNGRVTDIEYNKEYSTIRNMESVRKTLEKANQYVFEKDPTAPPRECGRMTFNIEIDL